MFRSLRPSATAAAILLATRPWRPLVNAHVAFPSGTSDHLPLPGQASVVALSSVALLASRRELHVTASPLLASGKKSSGARRKVRGMPGSARRASATSASIRAAAAAAAAVAGTATSTNATRAPRPVPTSKSAPVHTPTTKDDTLEDEVASADALADREHSARHAHLGAPGEEEEEEARYGVSPAHAHLGEAEEVELAAQITDVHAYLGDGEANVTEVEEDMSERMDHTASSSSVPHAMAGDGSTSHTAPTVAVGSLLDFESPLNLRLSTLTRQDGKAFRAVTLVFPLERASMNFEMTFEDIASGARLTCKVDDLVSEYYPWVAQFRASFIAIFLPTMQHPNATLLQNAILHRHPARPPVPADVAVAPRFQEDPDHLFFSYTKLREIISQKKSDVTVNSQLLTVAVLNAYPDEWKAYITTPGACAPQPFLLATFNFKNKDGSILNKELLHAQLSLTAESKHATAVAAAASQKLSSGGGRKHSAHNPATVLVKSSDPWTLVFVSAPAKSSNGIPNAIPPMQDLLTGQFIEPLSLSEKKVVYIVGSGSAANAFSIFPPMRKGKLAYSILLQDVELQLGMSRHQRSTLTLTLARALDSFSRFTWLNLMDDELQRRPGQKREPGSQNSFYRLQRRTVQREILPSFLESVFAPSQRLAGIGEASGVATGGGGASLNRAAPSLAARSPRQLEAHMNSIFNNEDRLQRERQLKDTLCGCKVLMVHLNTAGVTAARRADNPFSTKNGIVEASTQMWSSITVPNPPSILVHTSKASASGARTFISPDVILPKDFPIGPRDAPNAADRAENAVLVAWDVKRVLLFLRDSRRLRAFLANGGRVWCAQYAQYMLKGFNQHNLASMERTLVQFHNGPLKSQMRPLAKLKLVYETQLDLAVNSRQLTSIVHRMDGLLASAEMEANGLQLVPQSRVTQFADNLRRDHERLEKVLQEKVVDFTKNMDDEVRQRLNFRSPQDITTLIYGGGFCRHLGARFVPVRPTRFPITAILPQAVCRATGTPVPHVYTQPATLLGSDATQSSASSPYGAGASHGGFGGSGASGAHAMSGEGLGVHFSVKQVERALQYVDIVSKRSNMETVLESTAVVVLIARTKMGGLLEQVSLYCPSTGTGMEELNVRIVTDELLPVSDKPNLVTIMQLKDLIRQYTPLQKLQPRKKNGKRSWEMRNVLILTKCSHERLEPLVDTGVVEAIEETILGTRAPTKGKSSGRRGHPSQASSPHDDEGCSAGVSPPPPLERVCFADLEKAFPTPSQGVDSFQADFAELGSSNAVPFSAKAHWEYQTRELVSLGGYEEAMRTMLSHCAGAMGTMRDAFRNTHVIPSAMPQGLHGQEQATTPGMLWTVTPPALHPILCSFLKGRAASSGADAMERVTVFLNPYKDIDLTFFSALQQLRFTEKKLQLFEEGCLFRAVLPESNDRVHGELCHCVTATGRLSSQAPNLQNIPKEEDLRRLMISRFGPKGRMIEADYSQLEVVVLAALSRDARMMQELREKVDFHCLRVSLMMKEPYADVVRKCKTEKDPVYIQLRQQAKVFSFQRQYGAGAATISSTTGLTEAEVDELIHAEEAHYKDLGRYYQLVMSCVQAGADRLLHLRTLDTGSWSANMRRVVMLTEPLYYFVVPTGSKFDFTKTRHSVPRLKNYPVQGLAGEIVQVMCGKVVRRFLETHNYGGKAFLVNTVHDCVWVDAHVSVAKQVAQDIDRIMGSAQEVLNELWPDMKIDVPFSVEVASGVSLGEMSKASP